MSTLSLYAGLADLAIISPFFCLPIVIELVFFKSQKKKKNKRSTITVYLVYDIMAAPMADSD